MKQFPDFAVKKNIPLWLIFRYLSLHEDIDRLEFIGNADEDAFIEFELCGQKMAIDKQLGEIQIFIKEKEVCGDLKRKANELAVALKNNFFLSFAKAFFFKRV